MISATEEEWLAKRIGKITASRAGDVMDLGEGGEFKSGPRKGQPRPVGKGRLDYIDELATERLIGKGRPPVKAAALEHGKEKEPEAIAAYEAIIGELVEPGGFVVHPLYEFVGASPDFLMPARRRGGEVKCPINPVVHLRTLRLGLPEEHIGQIQFNMWVTGLDEWVFLSYHEDFPQHQRLYVQVVRRDNNYIAQLEAASLTLEAEVRNIINGLKERQACAA